jgi:hypothetical protein
LLRTNKIRLKIRKNLQWINFGEVRYKKKSKKTLKFEFENCFFSHNTKAILKDKFFVCERAARMHMLNSIYKASKDFIVLNPRYTGDEVKKAIKTLLQKNLANACMYCNAGKKKPEYVPAGKQVVNH